jgi:hypothetical protein
VWTCTIGAVREMDTPVNAGRLGECLPELTVLQTEGWCDDDSTSEAENAPRDQLPLPGVGVFVQLGSIQRNRLNHSRQVFTQC